MITIDEADLGRETPDPTPAATSAPDRTESVNWWIRHAAAAVALPPLLFLVLRPESYGLTPNELDPWFYSGYTHNFDDIMAAIGDRYYFVTRWTAYMPGRLTDHLLGPGTGRLVLRWVAATGLLMSLWHLGRRWKWTAPAELVIGTLAITMPMFARAFLTDYVEWFVVVVGTVLTAQCLEPRRHVLRHGAIGALVAALLIANPLSLYVAVAPVGYYVLSQRSSWWGVLSRTAWIVGGGLLIAAIGLVAFREFYAIPNVYEPTIDFVRASTDYQDLLKSPRLEWLGAYTWIYIPAMLAGFALAMWSRHRPSDALRDVPLVAGILLAIYVLLVIDQFVRDGNGLEISYYWSFAVPAILVSVSFLLGVWRWTWPHALIALAAWWAGLVAGRVTDVRLPGGAWLAAIAILVVAVVGWLGTTRPAWATAALMAPLLAAQTFAPAYDPTSYHPYNTDPNYRDVYYRAGNDHDDLWRDMQFALEQLDRVDDTEMYFWQGGSEQAFAAAALYGAFVTNHNLLPDGTGHLNAESRRLLHTDAVERLVITGNVEFVDRALFELSRTFESVHVLLDERYEREPAVRLLAVTLDNPRWPRIWLADELNALTGETAGTARVGSKGEVGFVAFGPGVVLEPGSYSATYRYAVDGPPGASAGFVDVALQESTHTKAAEMLGTGGQTDSITVAFEVDEVSRWEFRVYSSGTHAVRVESIELAREL